MVISLTKSNLAKYLTYGSSTVADPLLALSQFMTQFVPEICMRLQLNRTFE